MDQLGMNESADHAIFAAPRTSSTPGQGALGRKSAIVKRSIELNGHKTSVSLEDEFWEGLRGIAETRNIPMPILLQSIDAERGLANLSSAIRVFVFEHHRSLCRREPGFQER